MRWQANKAITKVRRSGIGVTLLVSSALLTSCATSSAALPPPTEATMLRLGYQANVTAALPLVGVNDGTFQRALGQTQLKPVVFNAGPAAVEALFAGSIDAAYLGPVPAINAFTRSDGQAVRIISGAAGGGVQLVVQPGITSAAELAGKRVATPQLGGTQDVALRYWLKSLGLSAPVTGAGDLSVTPEDNAASLLLFNQHAIAGAWVPEPWASRLVVQGGGQVLVDERALWPGGIFVTTNLVVSTTYLHAHPQTVNKLLQGELATLGELTKNPVAATTKINDALAKLVGKRLDEAVLARAWGNLTITVDPLAATLRAVASHSVAVGVSRDANLAGIYDLSLLNTLLRTSGRPPVSAAGLGKE